MTIEEAIQTAIQYENDVRDFYREAAEKVGNVIGKRVCKVMADEEQDHVDYLRERLAEWHETGKVTPTALKTSVPSHAAVAAEKAKLSSTMSDVDRGTEIEMLGKALEAERKTSSFYKQMVAELPPEGQALFARFLEIEEGHFGDCAGGARLGDEHGRLVRLDGGPDVSRSLLRTGAALP